MPFPKILTKQWGKEVGWKCEVCGRRWKDGWLLEAHHKIPSSMGGKDTRDNFQLLCVSCHMAAHEDIERKGRLSARLIRARLNTTKGKWR